MKKQYYYNGKPVTSFSEPKGNSFRDGDFWIKAFPDREALSRELRFLRVLSGCSGIVQLAAQESCGVVSIIPEDGSVISFPAIKECYAGEKDIREYCKKHYFEDEIIALFIKLAQSLAVVEAAGIIHNDVKHKNVIVSDNGEPVLIDFNISKRIDEEVSEIHKYASGNFQAPEKRDGVISIKGDIFSFGCVMGACMSQHPDNEAYSKGLLSVRSKCCMQDPSKRFGSFIDVKKALEQLAAVEKAKTIDIVPASKAHVFDIKGTVTRHLPLLTTMLYGCGLFFIVLALYLILWGPDKSKDYSPSIREDIVTVVTNIKTDK